MRHIIIHSKINSIINFFILSVSDIDNESISYTTYYYLWGEQFEYKDCNETIYKRDCEVLYQSNYLDDCFNKVIVLNKECDKKGLKSIIRRLKLENLRNEG